MQSRKQCNGAALSTASNTIKSTPQKHKPRRLLLGEQHPSKLMPVRKNKAAHGDTAANEHILQRQLHRCRLSTRERRCADRTHRWPSNGTAPPAGSSQSLHPGGGRGAAVASADPNRPTPPPWGVLEALRAQHQLAQLLSLLSTRALSLYRSFVRTI